MASGGARATSGPSPDPEALRRDRKSDPKWIDLPAEGRVGPPPEWPLTGKAAHIPALTPSWLREVEDEEKKQLILDQIESEASALFSREIELWTEEWRRPQAVKWEQNGQEVEVALYVRALVAAETPNAKVTLRTLVKQQQEALGLSLPGLARNHWRVEDTAELRADPVEPKAKAAKSRFKVIDGDKT
jgi:hypothetical protein